MTATYPQARLCRLCRQLLTRHQIIGGSVVCTECLEELLAADELAAESDVFIVEGPSEALHCHRDHTQIQAGRFCPACGEE
jgi:hypothetical protein